MLERSAVLKFSLFSGEAEYTNPNRWTGTQGVLAVQVQR